VKSVRFLPDERLMISLTLVYEYSIAVEFAYKRCILLMCLTKSQGVKLCVN